MPMYVNFLKEILSKNKKIDKHETIAFGKESHVVLLNKLLIKLRDLSSFIIPCLIGNVSINRALCDLGSSVSLMPYSIFKGLDLEELRPTHISLQLADRSIKYPLDILADVSIKVGDFYMPIDYVILDMAEDAHT